MGKVLTVEGSGPEFGSQNQCKKLGGGEGAACACNPSAAEAGIVGSLELAGQQPSIFVQF